MLRHGVSTDWTVMYIESLLSAIPVSKAYKHINIMWIDPTE